MCAHPIKGSCRGFDRPGVVSTGSEITNPVYACTHRFIHFYMNIYTRIDIYRRLGIHCCTRTTSCTALDTWDIQTYSQKNPGLDGKSKQSLSAMVGAGAPISSRPHPIEILVVPHEKSVRPLFILIVPFMGLCRATRIADYSTDTVYKLLITTALQVTLWFNCSSVW